MYKIRFNQLMIDYEWDGPEINDSACKMEKTKRMVREPRNVGNQSGDQKRWDPTPKPTPPTKDVARV